jgi:transposase
MPWLYNICFLIKNTKWSFKKQNWKIPKGNQEHESKEEQKIQWPKEKGQTIIYKTQHRKITVERHEP